MRHLTIVIMNKDEDGDFRTQVKSDEGEILYEEYGPDMLNTLPDDDDLEAWMKED